MCIDERGKTPAACLARDILDRIGDKWSLYVISRLGDGPVRFNALKRDIEGISQRMLTVTLRNLERDGIVVRTVHSAMPPRVDYELTKLGGTLLETVSSLVGWAEANLLEIDAAREDYDARGKLPQ